MPSYRWKRIEKLNRVDRIRLGRVRIAGGEPFAGKDSASQRVGRSREGQLRVGQLREGQLREGMSRGDFFASYRVDAAHDVAADANDTAAVSVKHPTAKLQTNAETSPREQWLGLQAADLIERLQAWESDLDAREAQLNSRAALQEHRERQFRLEQQAASTDLAEQTRAAQRLHADLKAQARRLAFEG
ncbi:hypothetical protein [Novipirellula rosea]|uniref:Chromosome partition protein Smc n=1 Tax=Novipirellula rosea TaxID=1031540 RepID=A0ABP8NSY8_9BACT